MTRAALVRLGLDEVDRFKAIRLASLMQAPEAFGTTHAEAVARPDDDRAVRARRLPPDR